MAQEANNEHLLTNGVGRDASNRHNNCWTEGSKTAAQKFVHTNSASKCNTIESFHVKSDVRKITTPRRARITGSICMKTSVECGGSQKCSAKVYHPLAKLPSRTRKTVSVATTPERNKNLLAGTGESRLASMRKKFMNRSEKQSKSTGVKNTNNEEQPEPYPHYIEEGNEVNPSV